jgi:hypothetical protein
MESHFPHLFTPPPLTSYPRYAQTYFLPTYSNSTSAHHLALQIKKTVDEEKSKHAGFTQENGFGPTF